MLLGPVHEELAVTVDRQGTLFGRVRFRRFSRLTIEPAQERQGFRFRERIAEGLRQKNRLLARFDRLFHPAARVIHVGKFEAKEASMAMSRSVRANSRPASYWDLASDS